MEPAINGAEHAAHELAGLPVEPVDMSQPAVGTLHDVLGYARAERIFRAIKSAQSMNYAYALSQYNSNGNEIKRTPHSVIRTRKH